MAKRKIQSMMTGDDLDRVSKPLRDAATRWAREQILEDGSAALREIAPSDARARAVLGAEPKEER